MLNNIFTNNQQAILRILLAAPDQALTMSEMGRVIGKAPGVFQRGLNSLEGIGIVVSHRRANLRLLQVNKSHPLYKNLPAIFHCDSNPLPADIYQLGVSAVSGDNPALVREPPGVYTTSQLKILIIAGPNGAGKTTFAREYLPREAGCLVFINADFIAHGLSPFSPERAAVKAGRIMLKELDDHIAHRRSIALETTLSGRRYARLIPFWQAQGYAVKLIYLSLPDVEFALARVAGRVRQGGHSIPAETVRRRFDSGQMNFNTVYKPLVDAWAHYDCSGSKPILIAEKER